MINQDYKKLLSGKSVIREQFEFATELASEIGADNVFNYSLGNPSVPTHDKFTQVLIDILKNEDPVSIHGYSPSLGITSVRTKVANSLNQRFNMNYTTSHLFMTNGAASSMAHALRAVTKASDEVITFAPYFPEYAQYVGQTGAVLKVVEAQLENLQVNFEAFKQMLNPKVNAVIINTPNNPSGIAYSKETIIQLTNILKEKEIEYGHEIFIISDEPYREILFAGNEEVYPSHFYDNTLSCYSFSKSLSLPGERIGYIAVNPKAKDADILVAMFGQISRGIGHNCPASSIQLAVAEVLDKTSDLSIYETNMNLIYNKLVELGFEVVKPGGTFYIFPKALEEDANAFCMKARKYNLILVPSDSFGVKGYFRMAYCVDTEKVIRSLAAIESFVKTEYPSK